MLVTRCCQQERRRGLGGSDQILCSKSPHTLRRGYITAALNAGQSVDVTAERTNVSREVLDKNYDARTESEKREVRRKFLSDI